MIESRRRAYLEALGIEVWVTRPAPPEPGHLIVSPDPSGTLLICNVPEDSATRFAGDVVRVLGGQATWAWPDPGGGENGVRLAAAIADRLITRVIVFGPGPARWLFGGEPPEAIGSAVIAAAPGLDELAGRASAKRAFWRLLQEFSDAAAPASH